MYIPEPGMYFRIVSTNMDGMFVMGQEKTSLNHPALDHRQVPDNYDYKDDSWFTLKESWKPGKYLVIHVKTGRQMYGAYDLHHLQCGLSDRRGRYDTHLWWFRPSKSGAEDFQLKNVHGSRQIFMRTHSQPEIGMWEGSCDDQFFRIAMEEVTYDLRFDLEHADFLGNTPKIIAQQAFTNNTSVEQQQTLSVHYTKTKTTRFTFGGGFRYSISSTISVQAGIPEIGSAEASISIGFEAEVNFSTERETSETEEMDHEFPVVVPPGKKVTAKILINEQKVTVPYTLTSHFKGSKTTKTTWGMWNATQCVYVNSNMEEEDI